MASTGITRCLDKLGRVTIPKEARKNLGIDIGTPLLINVEGNRIVLEKSGNACAICGSTDDLKTFNDKGLCQNCVEKIKAEM